MYASNPNLGIIQEGDWFVSITDKTGGGEGKVWVSLGYDTFNGRVEAIFVRRNQDTGFWLQTTPNDADKYFRRFGTRHSDRALLFNSNRFHGVHCGDEFILLTNQRVYRVLDFDPDKKLVLMCTKSGGTGWYSLYQFENHLIRHNETPIIQPNFYKEMNLEMNV